MYNMEVMDNLINGYDELAYTGDYIFGYTYNKMVCFTVVNHSILKSILTLDKASRGCGYALRFCPNKETKELLHGMNANELISEQLFAEMVASSKYNKGEIFEKLVTEFFGQTWTKDNVPFTEAGDIEVDGVAYQIKFQKATFCNEKSLENLRNKVF